MWRQLRGIMVHWKVHPEPGSDVCRGRCSTDVEEHRVRQWRGLRGQQRAFRERVRQRGSRSWSSWRCMYAHSTHRSPATPHRLIGPLLPGMKHARPTSTTRLHRAHDASLTCRETWTRTGRRDAEHARVFTFNLEARSRYARAVNEYIRCILHVHTYRTRIGDKVRGRMQSERKRGKGVRTRSPTRG